MPFSALLTLRNRAPHLSFDLPTKTTRTSMSISIKTPEEIEKMRVAGRLASEVLDYIEPFVKVGVTTEELDRLCHDYMVNVQACIPAPLNYAPSGYNPYPKSICTSVNQQVCHGVPSDRVLKSLSLIHISEPTRPY